MEFKKASEQPKEFTFSGENNMTPDQCWEGYVLESYKYRNYSQEDIDNYYDSCFLDRDEENMVADVLKNCLQKSKIRKAAVYLKRYLENMKNKRKPVEFKFENVKQLKFNNVNLKIKK